MFHSSTLSNYGKRLFLIRMHCCKLPCYIFIFGGLLMILCAGMIYISNKHDRSMTRKKSHKYDFMPSTYWNERKTLFLLNNKCRRYMDLHGLKCKNDAECFAVTFGIMNSRVQNKYKMFS